MYEGQRNHRPERAGHPARAPNGRPAEGDGRRHRAPSGPGRLVAAGGNAPRPAVATDAGAAHPRVRRGGRPDEFGAAVAGAIEETRRQDALLQLVSARTVAALGAAGIRATALKGPGLGEVLYGEAGRRLSSDIDLLVAAEQLDRAVEVVRELGYARPSDHVYSSGLPLLHFAMVHEGDRATAGGAALARPLV